MKEALEHWEANSLNDSEDFWQKSLSDRSYVLGQMFAYPVVVIGEKAYVGGKQVTSKGGKEVDFLAAAESTDALILIEIKTPQTKLLGSKYREDVFPFSRELAGAVAQVLRYRQSLMKNFDLVTSGSTTRFTLGEPRCVVICGSTEELCSADMRESFELQRDRFQGVSVITYDELFSRLQQLINLLESPSAAAE